MSATRGHFFRFVQFDGGIFPDKFCHVRENDNGRSRSENEITPGTDQNRPRLPECAPSAARSQTETGIYTDQQHENAIQGAPGAPPRDPVIESGHLCQRERGGHTEPQERPEI